MTPISLTHGQNIRIASWANTISASVFTTRGYAIENGECPDEAVTRARGFGHDLVGSIYSAGALVGDRALAMKLAAEERARAESAAVLADGDMVEIDGALHRVVVMRGNTGLFPANCDPIHFRPI